MQYELPEPLGGLKRRGEGWLMADDAVSRGIDVHVGTRGALMLTFDGDTYRFRSGASSLQPKLVGRCCRQKEISSRLLRARGVSAPANTVFESSQERPAWAWAKENLPVVIKPHDAAFGSDVQVGIRSRRQFRAAWRRIAEHRRVVLVEQMVPGVDHRIAVVDGRAVAAVRRVPMNVVGNGQSTIAELIERKNADRKQRRNPVHKRLKLDDDVRRKLASNRLRETSVPAEGQVVYLRDASNISAGGDAIDVTDTLDAAHLELAERAAAAIPGLVYGGFDVMIDGRSAACIEVNHAPMFSMHQFPWEGAQRRVWSAVLDVMFPSSVSA